MRKWIIIGIHLLIWSAILVLPEFIVKSEIKTLEFYLRWGLNMSLVIALFYFYFLYFNPRYLGRRTVFKYLFGTIPILGIFSLLKVSIFALCYYIFDFSFRKGDAYLLQFRDFFLLGFVVFGFALFFNLISFWLNNQQLKVEMEKQQLRSELDLLKYQVNPHFLFNTLNNIYALVYQKADAAPNAVLQLSRIMRYMIYETNAEKVPLEKEIEYLNYFVELQKLRLKEGQEIYFTVEGETHGKMIEPMLLIPFVENAFKHGIKGKQQDSIFIDLKIENEYLIFKTKNAIAGKEVQKDEYSGIGLENVKKRLALLFSDRYDLSIKEGKDTFQIDLKIVFS